MSTARASTTHVGTRRPRDRKAQILAAAATQFSSLGYNNAGIAGIADTVGITPGAVYRHFRNKEALLAELTLEGSGRFVEALADDGADFTTVMDQLVPLAVSRRNVGVLWQREARNLPEPERTELRQRLRFCHQRISELIASRRPALDADTSSVLAWAVIAVLISPSYHRAQIPDDRFIPILTGMIGRVADARFDSSEQITSLPDRSAIPSYVRRSRRELLLVEAAKLFAERGFHAVTMDDIGEATGMAGPSIYNHFAKKEDILLAALNRGADLLDIGLNSALAQATSAAHALHLALRSYIDLMTRHPALVTIVVNEAASLPEPLRHRMRSRQREYVDEWVHLLATIHPDADGDELRAIALAALTAVNIVVNSHEAARRADLAAELSVIGDRIMEL